MKTKLRRIFSLVLIAVLLISSFSYTIAVAANLSDDEQAKINSYEKEQEELRQKIKDANNRIAELKNDIAQQEAYVSELTAQIDNYQTQIDALQAKIDELEEEKKAYQSAVDKLNDEIAEIQAEIDNNKNEQEKAQQEIENIMSELKGRLYDLYVNGSKSDLEILLDFDNTGDFASYLIMLEMTQRRAEHDDELINGLNYNIKRLEELNKQYASMISVQQAKIEEQQIKIDELQQKQDQIEASQNELEASQKEIDSLREETYAYLDKLDASSSAYEKLVNSYQSQINAFEAKIDAILSNASKGNGVVTNPGGFIWPLQYSDAYISSSYGYRTLFGRYSLHGGVDTCCRSGTSGKNVSAAASGTVIIATYNAGGYGWYVGIDHGNGLVTIYGHNNQLLVSVGQHVSQGQTIAYAGATGNVTGAHVHFEVRVNGNKVDPLNYVSLS